MIRIAAAIGITVLAVGCGAHSEQTSSSTAQAPATQASSASEAPDTVLDVTIAGGTVTPVNAELNATVGRTITLRVDSDAEDELHVHSVPEHTFEVAAAPSQTFEFTVDVPGRVEIELHHLGRTVATLQVRP